MLDILYYILIGLGIFVFLVLLTILAFYMYLKLLKNKYKNLPYNDPKLRRIVKFVSRLFVRATRLKYKLVGGEKVPKDNFLFYGNHQSGVDPFILLSEFGDRDLGGLAKEELKKVPIVKDWLGIRGILPLNRHNARKGAETMVEVIKRAKDGQPMFVFPEGTRSKTGDLLDFKPGAFKLALKSKKDIYPFVMNGLNKHRFYHIKRSKCEVEILDPITYDEYSDMSTKELSNLVRSRIKENLG
ncbi:lysophospholipid acyltransferase family protein [Mycoplasmatota bacterium WC44]